MRTVITGMGLTKGASPCMRHVFPSGCSADPTTVDGGRAYRDDDAIHVCEGGRGWGSSMNSPNRGRGGTRETRTTTIKQNKMKTTTTSKMKTKVLLVCGVE